MPIETAMGPFMQPVLKVRSMLMNMQSEKSHYTPIIKDNYGDSPTKFLIRREFDTGSRVFSVFNDSLDQCYDNKLFSFVRANEVKGVYNFYIHGQPDHIGFLRASPRANVLLYKTSDGTELELGWHIIEHKVDILDHYRIFHLADGQTYQWTYRGKFLERVHNLGQREAEVRERVARVEMHPKRIGFDIVYNPELSKEMVLTTAMVCYIDAWSTLRGFGGIYGPQERKPCIGWKRS